MPNSVSDFCFYFKTWLSLTSFEVINDKINKYVRIRVNNTAIYVFFSSQLRIYRLSQIICQLLYSHINIPVIGISKYIYK